MDRSFSGEDGEPKSIFLNENDEALSKDNRPPPSTDTTIKPVGLAKALAIRMPKIVPVPRLIDCPLARDCSLYGRHGFQTEELLHAHLAEAHRDWQRTFEKYKEMGWVKQRRVKPYDCPLARDCSRLHVHGVESDEEVLRHMDVQHGRKDPKEGDILIPKLSYLNY
ncbi:hypothetical protein N7G274_005810 [Stereocaulon virgatum]|uniref:Uncharacterized protein n=1 Tax=Stereocaulon virgatum TaxID=373712 RepID=A0ABR4A6X4_9LECA